MQNGGEGDGSGGGGGAAPANKGKGKGKGKDMFENKPICYNWNNGMPCKVTPCKSAHVCLICQKHHPKKDNM